MISAYTLSSNVQTAAVLPHYYEFQATTDSSNEEEADAYGNIAVSILDSAAGQSLHSEAS